MDGKPQYIPKQVKALLDDPGKVAIYNLTGGAVLADFAAHNLTLIPSIPPNAVIHDNACGPGSVTKLLLAPNTKLMNPKIHTTDIDGEFLSALESDVKNNAWPVEVSNQKSEALSFNDDYFDLSVNNMGIIFTSSNGLDGAKEIYRTLKPGGTAIVNCWQHITWMMPILKTQKTTRPGKPFPKPPVNWSDGTQLKKIMLEAGFKEENVRLETSKAYAQTWDLRRWAEMTWAFLGGMGGWHEEDEDKWDGAIDALVDDLLVQEGTKRVGEEVRMRASQWVLVATK